MRIYGGCCTKSYRLIQICCNSRTLRYGIDLLGYRYDGNAAEMIRRFLAKVNAPVCVAGSIDSYERLGEVKAMAPWAFTIGGAFFEGKFLDGHEAKEDYMTHFCEQINRVCNFMERG